MAWLRAVAGRSGAELGPVVRAPPPSPTFPPTACPTVCPPPPLPFGLVPRRTCCGAQSTTRAAPGRLRLCAHPRSRACADLARRAYAQPAHKESHARRSHAHATATCRSTSARGGAQRSPRARAYHDTRPFFARHLGRGRRCAAPRLELALALACLGGADERAVVAKLRGPRDVSRDVSREVQVAPDRRRRPQNAKDLLPDRAVRIINSGSAPRASSGAEWETGQQF